LTGCRCDKGSKLKNKRWITVGLCAVLAASTVWAIQGPAASVTRVNSPTDSLMIVTANLREAWEYQDTLDHGDMDVFVQRVLDEKFLPDVLAVQEVRKSAVKYIANKLSDVSNQDYRVVVMPPNNPSTPYKGRPGAYDTSIIANLTTMRILSNGGFMPAGDSPANVVEPYDPIVFNAYALLQRRGTDAKYATMSIHLYHRSYLKDAATDKAYRLRMAKKMRALLYKKYGSRRGVRYLLVGDYNEDICAQGDWDSCRRYQPFASNLMSKKYKNTAKNNMGVDYFFVKGKPGALWDEDNMSPNRYSDHTYKWTIIGPDRYAPQDAGPLKADLFARSELPSNPPAVKLKWKQVHDRSGVGFAGFTLRRKVNDSDPQIFKLGDKFFFNDLGDEMNPPLEWGDTVRYTVEVCDKKNNCTAPLFREIEVTRENIDKI
jgi:exonuclease III